MTEGAFVCSNCRHYLSISTLCNAEKDVCSVCMGLWHVQGEHEQEKMNDRLEDALFSACAPYGGVANNRFSQLKNHAPTISISGDIYTRYHWFAQTSISSSFSVFLSGLKQHLQARIKKITAIDKDNDTNEDLGVINQEEQGYLSLHIMCVPPKGSTLFSSKNNKKRKRQRQRPFTTQGGHPRTTLEEKLKSQGYDWMAMTTAESTKIEKPSLIETKAIEFHVAVHRRPIYLYGYYTKSRRDVSQTPFIVLSSSETKNGEDNIDNNSTNDQKSNTKTLGVTSVEEQICGPIRSLLGVSTENNLPKGTVQYGMCKFHASGREDMDVRMLLRPSTRGRPFCVQLIDSLKPITSKDQLQQLVDTINHTRGVDSVESNPYSSTLWYGKNSMGVGISANFFLAPSKSFSNLQKDTETKVKHYGCYCWSERELPHDEDDLTSTFFTNLTFPLTIRQRTPLRVLHRRANVIRERQILEVRASRIDTHHFRLELSTQAGTYVKEFVHGDLRRTTPSIASIIGCKANLLELDCEGIDIDGEQQQGLELP